MIANYWQLIRNSTFTKFCLISSFSYGVLFSYFAMSPRFIIKDLDFSLIQYGLIVSINAVVLVCTAFWMPNLAKVLALNTITQVGASIIVLGGILMWALNPHLPNTIFTLMVPMFVATFGIGLIRPSASSGAMQQAVNKTAGSAAGLFSFLSFVGGVVSTYVSNTLIREMASFGLFIMSEGLICLIFTLANTTYPKKINK